MAQMIPTTQEIADIALTNFEASMGQTAPLNEKAFLRVMAALEALVTTGLYKYAAERAKQTLALTASSGGLDLIGTEFNTPRKQPVSAVLTATLPGTDDVVIPSSTEFIGNANEARYFMSNAPTIISGVAMLTLTAEVSGVNGNLVVGDELTIVSQVAGAETVATVTVEDTTGADRETDAAYRPRVLFAEQAVTGGGNATDHKIWAEQVEGCYRAFAYAGRPTGEGTSYPGDRQVYVEADTSIEPDGIPISGLLDSVRESLTTDPDTGLSRPGLGQNDANLWVEAITRLEIDVIVTTLSTPSGQLAAVKAAIEPALTAYLVGIAPFVIGTDLEQYRNDLITGTALSGVVQGILDATGSSAVSTTFEIAATPTSSYQLTVGELAKRGTVTYAV